MSHTRNICICVRRENVRKTFSGSSENEKHSGVRGRYLIAQDGKLVLLALRNSFAFGPSKGCSVLMSCRELFLFSPLFVFSRLIIYSTTRNGMRRSGGGGIASGTVGKRMGRNARQLL